MRAGKKKRRNEKNGEGGRKKKEKEKVKEGEGEREREREGERREEKEKENEKRVTYVGFDVAEGHSIPVLPFLQFEMLKKPIKILLLIFDIIPGKPYQLII